MKFQYWLIALTLFVLMNTAGLCAMTPESQQSVSDTTSVPGLQEQLKAVDLAIKGAVEIGLVSDPEIGQNQLKVTVISKRVTLEGKVPNQHLKDKAGDVAKNTKDVVDVLNLIEVDKSLEDKRFEFFPEDNPENNPGDKTGKDEKPKESGSNDGSGDSGDSGDGSGDGGDGGGSQSPSVPKIPGGY